MPLNLKPKSLDWTLKHVEKFGDTDIFPLPFEYLAIRECWEDPPQDPTKQQVQKGLRSWLAVQDMLNWTGRTHRRCLSPKHHFGFRVSTQLDPLDLLLFTSLVLEVGDDLEATRIPKSRNIVHSYRFAPAPDGTMYDPDYGYESFHQQSLVEARENDTRLVVVADIADFYPRVYSHPLENALASATQSSDHVTCMRKLLKAWNYGVSYGIPVGPAASRLLAEVAIADVDAALMSERYRFVRFVDDYRIFVNSVRDGYEALAFLANTLFENHGLTLQQHKTYIQSADVFIAQEEPSDHDRERKSLTSRFEDILGDLGVNSWYAPIEYNDLTPEDQAQIDALNLRGLLDEQTSSEDALDVRIVRFVLRRLGQLGDADAAHDVINNMGRLYPVFKDAIEYLRSIRGMSPADRAELGRELLALIDDDVVGHLEYHRAWIINTFASDRTWDNDDHFVGLFERYHDEFTRRETILALGRSGKSEWFKSRKRSFGSYAGWVKRAFLAAASSMPGDEASFWYGSIRPQLDALDCAVMKWAKKNPFGK